MKKEEKLTIDGENFSTFVDNGGNVQKIVFRGKTFEPPMNYTLYEINGEIADSSAVSSDKGLSLRLITKETSGKLTISAGKEVRLHFEPDNKDVAKTVSIILPFPLETKLHLPESYNLGRMIDAEMPVGEWYSTQRYSEEVRYMRGLGYNFFLANCNGMWLRFMTRKLNDFQRVRTSDVHISRHEEVFVVTFTWPATDDAYMAVFSSMDEAIKDFEAWMEKELGVKKLRDRPNLPEWVHNVRLLLIIDMMRPNWEIAHDYDDIANLAKELKEIGCPKDTLLYIPGWNGAYDSTYPTYEPHPELGGEEKFKKMIDALHESGFRVMIHTDAWGLDPCHPKIDEYAKYAPKDDNGLYMGHQTGGRIAPMRGTSPDSRPLKFRPGKVLFNAPKGAKSFVFETVPVAGTCEALITIGNLKIGDARVKFTIDRRHILTPSGWFKDHDEFAFPFPFLLKAGVNKVRIEVIGNVKPDWSEAWYKIRHCFVPRNPYSSWTYPILRADTNNPEWIKIFVDNVEAVVRKYGIDAVHVDATGYEQNKKILEALKERLRNIPIGAEGCASLNALGYWTFSQVGRQSLLAYVDVMRGTFQQGGLADKSAIEELYSWLNKPSPVNDFVKDYIYVYAHLCAADAFVPIGKVCNTFPTRFSPRCPTELWRVMRDAHKLNYIPTLRLNYRKYGLDDDTKKAIKEIASL